MRIEFIASLPPIQSAISLDGMGDGGRIKLDISRQYITELLRLQQMAGKAIKITAEVDEGEIKANTGDCIATFMDKHAMKTGEM
jgi:hypothetical protein